MNMTKALEKIAGRRRRTNEHRDIVCHRCGTECVLPAWARVDETVCIGCVQRLADPPRRHDRPATAVICGLGPYGYIAAMDAVAQMATKA